MVVVLRGTESADLPAKLPVSETAELDPPKFLTAQVLQSRARIQQIKNF
jgi:hypothetical protein